MTQCWLLSCSLSILAASGGGSTRADGTPIRLSPEPLVGPAGTVLEALPSPVDERFLLRIQHRQTLEVRLAVASFSSGGPPVLLTPAGSSVERVVWTPDGTRAVYQARTSAGQVRFHSVEAISGAVPVLLATPPLYLTTSEATVWRLTGDGMRLVYATAFTTTPRLFSVPVDGSAAPLELQHGVGFVRFEVASGPTVVFETRLQFGAPRRLYSVRADDPGAPVEIGPDPLSFEVEPTGSRVVFTTVTVGTLLFSTPVDGSAPPTQLSPAVASNREVSSFRCAPDGQSVVYRSDESVNNDFELFAVPIDGSAPPHALIPGEQAGPSFDFTPDGGSVLFDGDLAATTGFHRLRLADGQVTWLHPDPPSPFEWIVSPDGAWILFQRDGVLQQARLDVGGPATPVVPGLGAYRIRRYAVSANSARVVYTADVDLSGIDRLYALDVDPSGPATPVELGPPLAPEGEVRTFQVVDGARVVVRADANLAGRIELLRLPDDGSGTVETLDDPLLDVVGDVVDYREAGGRVVFRGDTEVDETFELFGVPARGGAAPVRLSGTLVEGGDVLDFRLTSDATRAVFTADAREDGRSELFSVSARGDTPRVRLNGALPPGHVVRLFEPGVDDSTVAFVTGDPVASSDSIWCAPTEGGVAALLAADVGEVLALRFSPGGRLLYERRESTGRSLWSLALDGSAPVQLALHANPFVVHLSPDGAWVVLVVDLLGPDRDQLLAVPVQGGPAVQLNPPPPLGGRIRWLDFAAGDRLVFFGNVQIANRNSLFSVPLDGSESALLLHGEVFGVTAALLSPDGGEVYLAGHVWFDDAATRLFRRPVDGDGVLETLLEPAPGEPIGFTADGTSVVWLSKGIQLLPVAGGPPVPVVKGPVEPLDLLPSDRLLYRDPSTESPGLLSLLPGTKPWILDPVVRPRDLPVRWAPGAGVLWTGGETLGLELYLSPARHAPSRRP